MSQTFKTQADVMVATAGKVDNTNDEVQGELTRLQGVVDSVRGSWVGQAQVSFDDLMQRSTPLHNSCARHWPLSLTISAATPTTSTTWKQKTPRHSPMLVAASPSKPHCTVL